MAASMQEKALTGEALAGVGGVSDPQLHALAGEALVAVGGVSDLQLQGICGGFNRMREGELKAILGACTPSLVVAAWGQFEMTGHVIVSVTSSWLIPTGGRWSVSPLHPSKLNSFRNECSLLFDR
ncbi:uncharacterized protein LOC112346326 [Selaginella moellendorffii]|uniref:uncharacterized protein LOC112346326 n=1 Tax=Selaginella moellendorffii TaxID=88036 RepID=UPI000D1C24EE|nr:uncharacterized protein LOC112346326 [Selaginella moellendorffii]|eukprot:XP_024530817.1 uncharacterized protein LOC112346326 [Selaginella moellendorffii]